MKFVDFTLLFLQHLMQICGQFENPTKESNVCVDIKYNYGDEKLIVIDTDAGVDDGIAILNFLGAENVRGKIKTKLITTVFGNTNVDNVGKNVLKLLKVADRLNIPVFRGSNESMVKSSSYVENFFGKDGFGDFQFSDSVPENLIRTKKHASIALMEAASENPGKLSLVCLGPLTNIAMAAKLDSNFIKNLKEIFILGGSDSGIGNVKPGVEFNFYVDPEAAFVVFNEAEKAGKLLTLVTWETVSVRTRVEMEWRKNVFGKVKNSKVDLINRAEEKQLTNDSIWISGDSLLSAVAIDGEIVEKFENYNGNVETCGQMGRGAFFINRNESDRNLTKNVRLIERVNVDGFKKILLDNFQR